MTDEEHDEYQVLRMMNDVGKFALQIGGVFSDRKHQFALQRLQVRGWVRLIDVVPIAEHPNKVFRIFLASEEAQQWFRAQG